MEEQQILSLFRQYSNMVYRLAYSYLHSSQDAEDLVQTVFLKLIDKGTIPEPGKERAYLTRTTINCCKDQLKSAWRRRTYLSKTGRPGTVPRRYGPSGKIPDRNLSSLL